MIAGVRGSEDVNFVARGIVEIFSPQNGTVGHGGDVERAGAAGYAVGEVEARFVVQVIVADVVVIAEDVTELITGVVTVAGVEKVKLADVSGWPAEFAEIAA